MANERSIASEYSPRGSWRHYLLGLIVLGSLALILSLDPIAQPIEYHNFADRRSVFGIPNFLNVSSNLPFLLVGAVGLIFYFRGGIGHSRIAWMTFFTGVALVSLGSAYYHWAPTNETLVWDRLPMTIGFMGLFVALVAEYIHPRLAKILLVPAAMLGLLSVVYWYWSGDLRPYAWVQLLPLLTIPVLMVVFKPGYSHQWLLLAGFGLYMLAKVAEMYDRDVFAATGSIVSGHSLKHLLAASAVFAMYRMVVTRPALD